MENAVTTTSMIFKHKITASVMWILFHRSVLSSKCTMGTDSQMDEEEDEGDHFFFPISATTYPGLIHRSSSFEQHSRDTLSQMERGW